MSTFVFTCGDINGIGPEIVIKTIEHIQNTKNCSFVIIIPANIFEETYLNLNASFKYDIVKKNPKDNARTTIIDLGNAKTKQSEPTKTSGKISYSSILKSFDLVRTNIADAIITAPISKYALSMSGIEYPGHTELYAELAGIKKYLMMFVSPIMRCALLSIHEPMKNVPALLNSRRLNDTIDVIIKSLREDFLLDDPAVAVLGLNPHAGENGRIGKEEEQVIKPVLFSSRYSRYLSGPYVPDAFFGQHLYKKFDIVLGMYHDQVLIPFKMLDFKRGVNYTAGLPFVRTSPDHGTAFNIAGKNIADPASMIESFKLAKKIVDNRLKEKTKRKKARD